jgi:hypothetical protein
MVHACIFVLFCLCFCMFCLCIVFLTSFMTNCLTTEFVDLRNDMICMYVCMYVCMYKTHNALHTSNNISCLQFVFFFHILLPHIIHRWQESSLSVPLFFCNCVPVIYDFLILFIVSSNNYYFPSIQNLNKVYKYFNSSWMATKS